MDEFELIEKYIAPLTRGFAGAYGLKNDAAVFSPQKGNEIVITADAISEGVHFLENTEPALIARKLLRVNLSDMAAMGATPKYYLITAALNKKPDEKWHREFTAALAKEQKEFGIILLGGDTVVGKGPMTFSLTMIGEVKKGRALTRSGAKVGDDVYVSGRIGDAALGLNILRSETALIAAVSRQEKTLLNKYHIPQPRVELGKRLIGVANAAIDISDGLLADLNHICRNSGVGAKIHRQKIPVFDDLYFELAVTGGDDYELLFTAPGSVRRKIQKLARASHTKISLIGSITRKKGVQVIDNNGKSMTFKRLGYKHV